MNGASSRLLSAPPRNHIFHLVQKLSPRTVCEAAPAKADSTGARTTATRKYLLNSWRLSNQARSREARRNSQADNSAFMESLAKNTKSTHNDAPRGTNRNNWIGRVPRM